MVNPITKNSISSDPAQLSVAAETLLMALQSLLGLASGDRPALVAAVKKALPEDHPTRQELTAWVKLIDESVSNTTSVTFDRKWCG